MPGPARKLGAHSAIYAAGMLLNKLLALALLPLYLRCLRPEDFGVYSLLNATANFARPLFWLGMGSALIWAVVHQRMEWRRAYGTAGRFLAVQGLVLCGVLALAAPLISARALHGAASPGLVRMVALTLMLETAEVLLFSNLRARARPFPFALLSVMRFLVGTIFVVVAVAVLRAGVPGLVVANLAAAGLFAALAAWLLRSCWTRPFDRPTLAELVRFGLPLVPAQICAVALLVADRFLLERFATTSEVGIYSLAANLALAVNLVVNAFQLAWLPQALALARRPEGARDIARLVTLAVMMTVWVGLGVSLLGGDLLRAIGARGFLAAAALVAPLALAQVLTGIAGYINIGTAAKNRTYWTTLSVGLAATFSIGVNLAAIPRWGMSGAAGAALAAGLLLVVLNGVVNHRLLPVPYEVGRLARLAAVAAALFAAAYGIPHDPLWLSLLLRGALAAAFPLLLIPAGFYSADERAWVARLRRERVSGADREAPPPDPVEEV